ncbi:MAG: c-type cytochrome domain-containing protein, partial [Pirellulales bacterium]
MKPSVILIGSIVLSIAWPAICRSEDEPTAAGEAFFEKKIRPLLASRCYDCHSTKAKKLKGGLRLDSRAALLAGGDSGPVVVSGKPNNSLLIEAVRY